MGRFLLLLLFISSSLLVREKSCIMTCILTVSRHASFLRTVLLVTITLSPPGPKQEHRGAVDSFLPGLMVSKMGMNVELTISFLVSPQVLWQRCTLLTLNVLSWGEAHTLHLIPLLFSSISSSFQV